MGSFILIVIMFLICITVYEAGRHRERESRDAEVSLLLSRFSSSSKKGKRDEDD